MPVPSLSNEASLSKVARKAPARSEAEVSQTATSPHAPHSHDDRTLSSGRDTCLAPTSRTAFMHCRSSSNKRAAEAPAARQSQSRNMPSAHQKHSKVDGPGTPSTSGESDVAEDGQDESSEVKSERPTYVDASAAPVRERALQELTALAGGGDNDAAELYKMSSGGSDILVDWTNARDDESKLRKFDLDADMDADQIIATSGQCLELGYSSPSWSMFNRVPCFEHELTYNLQLLIEREKVRRRTYGVEADDSRIGHTPPETEKHNRLRQWMEHYGAANAKVEYSIAAARRRVFKYKYWTYTAPSESRPYGFASKEFGLEAMPQQQNSSLPERLASHGQPSSEAAVSIQPRCEEQTLTEIARQTHARSME